MKIEVTKIENSDGSTVYRVSRVGGVHYFETIEEAVNCVDFISHCYR